MDAGAEVGGISDCPGADLEGPTEPPEGAWDAEDKAAAPAYMHRLKCLLSGVACFLCLHYRVRSQLERNSWRVADRAMVMHAPPCRCPRAKPDPCRVDFATHCTSQPQNVCNA